MTQSPVFRHGEVQKLKLAKKFEKKTQKNKKLPKKGEKMKNKKDKKIVEHLKPSSKNRYKSEIADVVEQKICSYKYSRYN
jgi:hypothetical protein